MLAQHLAVPFAELLEQDGRVLDVREEERDRPGRERGHAGIVRSLETLGLRPLALNRHRGARFFQLASPVGERGWRPHPRVGAENA
jgi:hypothetical protein